MLFKIRIPEGSYLSAVSNIQRDELEHTSGTRPTLLCCRRLPAKRSTGGVEGDRN